MREGGSRVDIQGAALQVVETASAKGLGWEWIVTEEQLGGQYRGNRGYLMGSVVGDEVRGHMEARCVWPYKPRHGLCLFTTSEVRALRALSRDLHLNRILWLLCGDQAEGIKGGGREAMGRLQL